MPKKIEAGKSLSPRALEALHTINLGTKAIPVLPRHSGIRLHRGAANHLVKRGLAQYRGFDGMTHGGYFITKDGRALLIEYGF